MEPDRVFPRQHAGVVGFEVCAVTTAPSQRAAGVCGDIRLPAAVQRRTGIEPCCSGPGGQQESVFRSRALKWDVSLNGAFFRAPTGLSDDTVQFFLRAHANVDICTSDLWDTGAGPNVTA